MNALCVLVKVRSGKGVQARGQAHIHVQAQKGFLLVIPLLIQSWHGQRVKAGHGKVVDRYKAVLRLQSTATVGRAADGSKKCVGASGDGRHLA